MGIKFIDIMSYWRAADTRELWSSNSFTSSRIGSLPIRGNYGNQIHLSHFVSAARRCQRTRVIKFHLHHLVSAACRYQATIFINFNHIISYRRAADTNRIQRHRVGHLHSIVGLRVAVGGSDLLGPVSSSSIGGSTPPIAGSTPPIAGSTPPIGGLSLNPLSHRLVDTVLSVNTTLPRCALELTQLSLLRSSKLCPFHNADCKPTEKASLSVSAQCLGSLSCAIT